MANSLKIKIGIVVFAIVVLALIPLLETKFFAPVTVKRWGKVSWDDFQGIPQPFSSYEAGISSSIYLEYDSSRGRYAAYAGQNNVQSWAKRSRDEQDYLLNHEQYHFNITELHAQKLNGYIEENPDGTLQLYLLRLGSVNIDLRRMQRQYDYETNHSLVHDKQRHWEFRIDSMLVLNSGWVTDKFSGARVFLPSEWTLFRGITDGKSRYRGYEWNKYGMSFTLMSFQNESWGDSTIHQILNNFWKSSDTVKAVNIDETAVFPKASVIVKDSSHQTSYSAFLDNGPYLFYLNARFPSNTADTMGYSHIARSFLNSFNVVDTDSLWIAEFEKSTSPITYSTANKMEGTRSKDSRYCLSIEKDEKPGFYREPIFRDDGALLLPFDCVIDQDSLHYSDVLLTDNEIYSFHPTSEGQIYFIPADQVPKSSFRIQFSYTLKKDSLKDCYQFYHHTLQITPQIQPTFAENGI